jgi:hypothetical protein
MVRHSVRAPLLAALLLALAASTPAASSRHFRHRRAASHQAPRPGAAPVPRLLGTDPPSLALAGGRARAQASANQITYHGGPVLSNVKVVLVEWNTNDGISVVDSDTNNPARTLASFYADVTNSAYLDWLAQYSTPAQCIGRGTFAGSYTITNVLPSLTNADVETSLLNPLYS